MHADPAIDAEDGSYRRVHVDVRRAVERVEEDGVLTHWILGWNRYDVIIFFRAHHTDSAGVLQAILQRLVGENVQLLLLLTLDVLNAGRAQNVHQAGTADRRGDDLGRQADVVQEVLQLARCLRVAVFLVEDEALDGGDV